MYNLKGKEFGCTFLINLSPLTVTISFLQVQKETFTYGGHESVTKLLVNNGAKIFLGDVGQFSCFAVEQNNVGLLKDIIRYGGDI